MTPLRLIHQAAHTSTPHSPKTPLKSVGLADMFLLDGRILQLDTPFEHDGTSYPANWLRLASPEARAAIGITEVVEQPRPDDRFYWVSGREYSFLIFIAEKHIVQIKDIPILSF